MAGGPGLSGAQSVAFCGGGVFPSPFAKPWTQQTLRLATSLVLYIILSVVLLADAMQQQSESGEPIDRRRHERPPPQSTGSSARRGKHRPDKQPEGFTAAKDTDRSRRDEQSSHRTVRTRKDSSLSTKPTTTPDRKRVSGSLSAEGCIILTLIARRGKMAAGQRTGNGQFLKDQGLSLPSGV